jgi:hypothetical protein
MIIMTALPKFTFFIKYPIASLIILQTQIAVQSVSAPMVVDIMAASKILGILFAGDMITGIWASYKVWHAKPVKKDKWFFGRGEGFSSDKFKKMGIKAIIYLAVPLLLLKFQTTFMVKNFKYESWSDAEITLPAFFVLLFCINEGFSIFFENLPNCGFSLFSRITKIAKVTKSIKKEFNDEP